MDPLNAANLAAFKAALSSIGKRATAAVKPSLEKSAADLVGEMQRLAPKDTGRLSDSIVATPAGETTPENAMGESRTVEEGHVVVTAGNRDVFYAPMVEFGTSKASAQPFFVPACNAMRGKIKTNLKTAISGAIKP